MAVHFALTENNWRPGKSFWGQPDEVLGLIFDRADSVTQVLISYVCKRFNRLIKKKGSIDRQVLKEAANSLQWHFIFDKIFSSQKFINRPSIDSYFQHERSWRHSVISRCDDSAKYLKKLAPDLSSRDLVMYRGQIQLLKFYYTNPNYPKHLVVGFIIPMEGRLRIIVNDPFVKIHVDSTYRELKQVHYRLVELPREGRWWDATIESVGSIVM